MSINEMGGSIFMNDDLFRFGLVFVIIIMLNIL